MNPLTHFNILKVLAMLLVVVAHVTRNIVVPTIPALGIDNWLLKGVTDFIYAFHMPAFIFVSGAVFQYGVNKGKYKDKLAFVAKKAKRLLLPYLFFSLLLLPTVWAVGLMEQSALSPIKYIFNSYVLCLDARHLWYLIALFGISVIVVFANTLNINKLQWGG